MLVHSNLPFPFKLGTAPGNGWFIICLTCPLLPDVKNWLIGKDPDAGKDWRQEEKGTTEDEMIGRHHRLDGHEFEQALGVGDGQGSLACCSPWGHKELDTTELLNWAKTFFFPFAFTQIFIVILSYLVLWPKFCEIRKMLRVSYLNSQM